MDIKSLLQNRKILLTLGGVLVVAIVMGAIYLPGTLFRGALTTTTELSTVSPTITAPISAIQPISPELTAVTTTTTESTTPESAAVPSNMATGEVADETLNMDAIGMLSTGTLEEMSTVSTVESDFIQLLRELYLPPMMRPRKVS